MTDIQMFAVALICGGTIVVRWKFGKEFVPAVNMLLDVCIAIGALTVTLGLLGFGVSV